MDLRRICAWCRASLDQGPAEPEADAPVTHGICAACLARFNREHSLPLADFLESLEGPVLLVDGDGVFQEANSRAYQILGKESTRVLGRRGGEVLECLYADLPGGCGASEHCRSGCVIRRSVTHTLRTGQAVVRALAEQEVHSAEGDRLARIVISTEKAGTLVLLRIEEIQ